MTLPPAHFGNYTLSRELGRGTTGVVYEAVHSRLGGRVALKTPLAGSEAERRARSDQFLRECQALAWLTARPGVGIPAIFSMDVAHGWPYCVRELVDGDTLVGRAGGPAVPLADGLRAVAAAAEAVGRAHAGGFAHGNLCPANVLVGRDGAGWLIGFGRVRRRTGARAAEDQRGLYRLVRWLFEAARRPIPPALDRGLREAGGPSAVAAVIRCHVGQTAEPDDAPGPWGHVDPGGG